MSDNQNFGFGKLVPGFDFLQGLAKGASQTLPQMPNLSNWVAPTLNLEDLEKRITELKAVHFWLDQNSKALGATIQALEVQKMTLATLKGMNVNMGDVANALRLKAADTMSGGSRRAAAVETDSAAQADAHAATRKVPPKPKGAKAPASPGVVDPLQWWGALTQQFQQIAGSAMKDAAAQASVGAATSVANSAVNGAAKTVAKGAAPRKRTVRKTPRKP